MAVDKKSDYVGNHGGAYTDVDGQSRQFTYVDHDPKVKIFLESDYDKDWQSKYREDLISRILSISAVYAHEWHQEFVLRGQEGIRWDEKAISDQGTPLMTLRDICVVLENRVENSKRIT